MAKNEEEYEAERAYLRHSYRVVVQVGDESDEIYLDSVRIYNWADERADEYGLDSDNLTDEDVCDMIIGLISADLDYEGISE